MARSWEARHDSQCQRLEEVWIRRYRFINAAQVSNHILFRNQLDRKIGEHTRKEPERNQKGTRKEPDRMPHT